MMKKMRVQIICLGLFVTSQMLFADFNATVSVNYTNVMTEKPLVGENAVFFCMENNVLDSNGDFTEEACDLGDKMRCEIMRFPGGGVANLYDWKRAIGANRAGQQIDWSDTDQDCGSEWGPDEAGRFAETNHGELVICLNFSKGAADAADFVEYMNSPTNQNPNGGTNWAVIRAENGHPEPYNVKYWEIGNESGGKEQPIWPNWPTTGDDGANDGIIQSTTEAQDHWIYGGSRVFTNQQAMRYSGNWRTNSVHLSQGDSNEEFYVKFPPVSSNTFVRVGPDGTNYTWTRVANVSNAAYGAHVYELDPATGRILFGDGDHGKILPADYKVTVTYESGPHDGYVDFYSAMTNVDPTVKVAASHLALIKRYGEVLSSGADVDGLQLHGGSGYSVNADNVPAGGDWHTELIGRGYFTYKQLREDSLFPMYNNNFPAGKKIYQTETALLDPCTWDSANGIARKYTISGALSHCLMFERAVSKFGDQSDYPMEMFMKTGYAFQAETTSMLGENKDVFVPTGIAKAQQLLIVNFGIDVLSETDQNIPSNNIPWFDMDGGSHTGGIPKVVPLVSLDSRGFVSVLAINTTTNETATLTVNVANIGYDWTGPANEVSKKSFTLQADSLTAINDETDLNRVEIVYALNPADITIVDSDTLSFTVAPLTARVVKVVRIATN